MSEKRNTILQSCLGSAKELSGLVDYAAESVVSKTFLDKQAGTITLFAFDAGQGLSEHTSPYDAVVQVVEGEGIFVIGQKPVEVSSGRLLIMPANVPHSVRAEQKFKMMLIMIRA
jgi:quercetin dioxygenase-like cupin family protein